VALKYHTLLSLLEHGMCAVRYIHASFCNGTYDPRAREMLQPHIVRHGKVHRFFIAVRIMLLK
jgi:hypothetical protein